MSSSITKREHGFDILRVLSMMYIIAFYHIDDYAEDIFTNRLTTVFMHIALSTFIFISGYILTNKYVNFTSTKDIINFIIKRVIRVYPLYLVALLLFFFVGLVSFEQFFTGLFLINNFLDIYLRTLWFISLIFIYYVLLAFTLYHYSFIRLIFIYLVINIFLYILHKYYGYISSQLFYYMPSFFIGILFSKYQVLRRTSKNKLFLIILLFVPLIFFYTNINIVPMSFVIVLVSLPYIYILSLAFNFNNNIIEKLSYASFTMYIFHRLIYQALLYIYHPASNTFIILYLLIIGVPLLFLISFYIQKLYDKLFTKTVVTQYFTKE